MSVDKRTFDIAAIKCLCTLHIWCMPVTRCSAQKRRTLEEFYQDWANEDNCVSANLSRLMMNVIGMINTTFEETKIYGLTSHAYLLLHEADNDESGWYVAIIVNGHEFHIDINYLKTKVLGKMLL